MKRKKKLTRKQKKEKYGTEQTWRDAKRKEKMRKLNGELKTVDSTS